MPLLENGRVVVDFDEKEPAREFYREHRELCTVIVETRRGVHFHFSGKTATRKFEHGDIKGNGFVVYPPSSVDGHKYVFVRQGELVPFPEELFPRKEIRLSNEPITEVDVLRRITRARAWLLKADPAVWGEHGGTKMFYCCCKLFQMFGLTMDQAWPLILEYNERAVPPFSEPELVHKLEDAAKAAQKGS
jgi:hypothetical protein